MVTHQDVVEAYEQYRSAVDRLDASVARQRALTDELAALTTDIPRLRDLVAAAKQALQDMLAAVGD